MTVSNLSVNAKSTRGSAHKKYMTVPGTATLELDDNQWKEEYAEAAAKMIEAQNLVIVEHPAEDKAEAEANALAEAMELIAKNADKSSDEASEDKELSPSQKLLQPS